MLSSSAVLIAEERNHNNFWVRDRLESVHMLNGCVLTKLLGDEENGTKDEVVLMVGANGGAVYTFKIPDSPDSELELVSNTNEEKKDETAGETSSKNVLSILADQLDASVDDFVKESKGPIEIKQCLTVANQSGLKLQNINSIAQGKGSYTDYLVGAPDNETRLYIFVRSYDNRVDDSWKNIEDGKQVIFELIEQQADPASIILPLGLEAPSEQTLRGIRTFDTPGTEAYEKQKVNSLTLAWAPWLHRSIIAAGTDTKRLIIYDFDAAQQLMMENDPTHIFDFAESNATILYQVQLSYPVRLLKFSPVPSIPILAVAESVSYVTFIDCRNWTSERVHFSTQQGRYGPPRICGMAWLPDASAILISTSDGIYSHRVKQVPSLTDRLLLGVIEDKDVSLESLRELGAADELMERAALMSFGLVRDKNAKVGFVPDPPPSPPHIIDSDDTDEDVAAVEHDQDRPPRQVMLM